MKNNDIHFDCIEEIVDYILEKIEAWNDLYITIIAKFDEAREILKEVMLYENVNFEILDLESPELNSYMDEYVLSLWVDDGVFEIGCEKLKRDGEYINPCGDETYLFSNCSSKIIPLCEGSDVYYIDADDDCECDEECCECCECCECFEDDKYIECNTDEDGNIHGFTASRADDSGYYSFSYCTSENLKSGDIRAMLKEYGF